jgi:uncharacterized protein YcbX
MLQLSEIWIYPVKSLGGISLQEAIVTERGLENDRRWLLVDNEGNFLTQRQYPQLAVFQPEIDDDFLTITYLKNPDKVLKVKVNTQTSGKKIIVKVWDDTMEALEVNEEANTWFSELLEMPVKLVVMPEETRREVDKKYALTGEEITSFADAYPFLVIGQSSLNDLNTRLEKPVLMNRFRPNLVFTGGKAYEEEHWFEVQIGKATFWGVKPCARCILTTIDQKSGEKTGKEPLYTLSTYRKAGKRVLFGQNLLVSVLDKIQVGDEIKVKSTKKLPQFEIENA